MFLEQEPIAEEQTISPQEQGMTQQGDETCVVETISYAPRFSLFFLQACSLRQFSNQINHYIDREHIAPAYLSMNQPFFYSRLNEPGQATPQKDNDNEQDFLLSTPQPAPRQPIAKTR